MSQHTPAPDVLPDPAGQLIAVLGAGTMGVGITTLVVGHGLPVVLVDVDESRLEQARAAVSRGLRMAQLMGKLPRGAESGALTTTTLIDDIRDATVVIEAVTEIPETKAKVIAAASAVIAPGTPLVSNTSGIPIDELAVSAVRPEDMVGAHFMNPPYLIPAIEVIRGPRSDEDALRRVTDLLALLGMNAIVVGDGPGFVINRVLQRALNGAAQLVQDGVADAESVDALFRGCLGHTTGPLATADLIGLDNVVDSLRVLYDRTGDAGYQPCELLLQKVAAGDFGRKTGRGFFEYGGVL
ncbi:MULTISPECIES: 3-hydroxyacyl-CoA dehydrogenase family protein [unclassified Streptomyces]|uniref:3-hydroxyacyl-CoA dehydrogenase family protein n=1 Tax=unclassified Streptomyces TaxID=2593676 RepID=UPI000ADBA5D0|nr:MULTISPECIES: 3-hydroxyacyl-CoA dehydrogenase family protein [unclassified Streptomyces]